MRFEQDNRIYAWSTSIFAVQIFYTSIYEHKVDFFIDWESLGHEMEISHRWTRVKVTDSKDETHFLTAKE